MIIFSNNIFVPRLADAGHLDYREVNHARVAIWTMIHFRKLNFFNFPSLIFDSSKLSLERLLHPPPPKECNRLLYCASKILIQINSNQQLSITFSDFGALYQLLAHFLRFQHTFSYFLKFWHTFSYFLNFQHTLSYLLNFQHTFSGFGTLSELLAHFLNFQHTF